MASKNEAKIRHCQTGKSKTTGTSRYALKQMASGNSLNRKEKVKEGYWLYQEGRKKT